MAFLDTLNKLLGDPNERELKKLWPRVREVRAYSERPDIRALSREDLPKRTEALKAKIAGGMTLDEVLPEAFAVVREGSKRVLKMRHFDMQLVGGMVLHYGKIAEMRTGEGKTLVATLPVYLNALAGQGVHVVTVNDYLARRDSEWMGRLYRFLGMSVGVIQHELNDQQQQQGFELQIRLVHVRSVPEKRRAPSAPCCLVHRASGECHLYFYSVDPDQ